MSEQFVRAKRDRVCVCVNVYVLLVTAVKEQGKIRIAGICNIETSV